MRYKFTVALPQMIIIKFNHLIKIFELYKLCKCLLIHLYFRVISILFATITCVRGIGLIGFTSSFNILSKLWIFINVMDRHKITSSRVTGCIIMSRDRAPIGVLSSPLKLPLFEHPIIQTSLFEDSTTWTCYYLRFIVL